MKVIALLVLVAIGIIILVIINDSKHTMNFTSNMTSISTPSSSPTRLANPASVNCSNKGGTLQIMTNGAGAQFGLCQFEDNQACEEWALYRGDCPVGGVNTIGYDTVQESYCAWLGGQTLAVANPNCKLPDGSTCTDQDLWNGTCPASL